MIFQKKMTDRETLKHLKRLSIPVETGLLPSVEMFKARSRIRGKGERIGFRNAGRIQDYHPMLSNIRDQPVFRDNLTTRQRRILLLVDFHTINEARDATRLVEATTLIGGMLLQLPETVTTVSVFGLDTRVRPCELNSVGQYGYWRKWVESLAQQHADPYPSAGKMRMATFLDPDAYIVFVSHYLKLKWLDGLSFPFGGCLFLVAPPTGGFFNSKGGAYGENPFQSTAMQEDSIFLKYENLADTLKAKRIVTHIVKGKDSPLEALEKALTSER